MGAEALGYKYPNRLNIKASKRELWEGMCGPETSLPVETSLFY